MFIGVLLHDLVLPFIFCPEASGFVSFACSHVSENISVFYTEKMAKILSMGREIPKEDKQHTCLDHKSKGNLMAVGVSAHAH